jgi:hypothetical protein
MCSPFLPHKWKEQAFPACAAAVQETEAVLMTDKHIPAVSIATEDEKTRKVGFVVFCAL